MTSLVQIFRFLVGLGMVAAGGFVAAPFISSVLSTASREVVTQTPCQQTKPFDRDKTTQSIPNSFTVPAKNPQGNRFIRQTNNPTESALSRLEEIPLPSQPRRITPERMPAHSLGNAPPGMYGAYRTTVEMPPPPLLDGSHAVASHRLQPARTKNIGPHRKYQIQFRNGIVYRMETI